MVKYMQSINEASKHGQVKLEYFPDQGEYKGYNNLVVSGILKEDEDYVLAKIEALGGYKLALRLDNIPGTHVGLILAGV